MAIGSVAIADFRRPFLDFSIPYQYSSATFMIVRKYSTLSDSTIPSMADFAQMMVLMLAAFTISAICGLLSQRWLKRSNYAPLWSLYECFFYGGSENEPTNYNQRILFFIWLFAGFITTATVGGNLVAILAKTPPKPITTIRELAQASHIKMYIPAKPIQATLKVTTL